MMNKTLADTRLDQLAMNCGFDVAVNGTLYEKTTSDRSAIYIERCSPYNQWTAWEQSWNETGRINQCLPFTQTATLNEALLDTSQYLENLPRV